MSNDVKSNMEFPSDNGDEVGDVLSLLLEHISRNPNAPEGLRERLKEMSEDPGFAQLAQEHKKDLEHKEEIAKEYAGQIHAFFDSKKWHYTSLDAQGKVMLLGFRMNNLTVRLQIMVETIAESLQFNIVLLTCQEEYRLAMSAYLTQLNLPLRYGAFHIDKDDGEVTYRYSVSYRGVPFSEETFEEYINACTIIVDQNFKEIGKIAYGRFTDSEKKEWFNKLRQLAVALSQ